MVMFLLSFVKGVQIRGGESISASGFGQGGPILGGSKSAGTPVCFAQIKADVNLDCSGPYRVEK